MTRIAVIGGGAAGIGAARELLRHDHEVLLIEGGARLGGNCDSAEVRAADGSLRRVDLGVSDFNRSTFRELGRLLDELGLETRPIRSDASFGTLDGRILCNLRQGSWSFSPTVREPEAFLRDVRRFREQACEVLEEHRFADWSVDRYLAHFGASSAFRQLYVHARAMGCFPLRDGPPGEHRMRDLVAFWKIHGLVGREPADRRLVVGGMHRWTEAFGAWFESKGGELRLATRVRRIERTRRGVSIHACDREGRPERFDASQLVLALPACALLPLLDAGDEERRVLSSFPFQRARVVLHRDPRLVGGEPEQRGAFHYLVPEGELPRVRPTITFFLNRLASLPADLPELYMSMNPHREPAPESVVCERTFVHPIAGPERERAALELERLQGRRRTWYAGSHLLPPFVHESALTTGIHAARRHGMQWRTPSRTVASCGARDRTARAVGSAPRE